MKHRLRKWAMLAALAAFFYAAGDVSLCDKLHAGESGTKSRSEVKNISVKQAKELIEEGRDIFVLDVRAKEEYNEGHIKGSHLIPLQNIEQNIHKIPKDKKVIVYCFSRKRSAKACEILRDKGLKELYNVLGGFQQWQSEGHPREQ